ncbi:MAG: hypothetical protein ACREDQ_12320, partial [Limisphaerales bacterium]
AGRPALKWHFAPELSASPFLLAWFSFLQKASTNASLDTRRIGDRRSATPAYSGGSVNMRTYAPSSFIQSIKFALGISKKGHKLVIGRL